MKKAVWVFLVTAWASPLFGGELLFEETFSGKLKEGWSWLRENRAGWRVGTNVLEIRIEPGNMWGPANDARNVLVRDLPDARPLELSVTVSNTPTSQYEQVDLVCYYDDSHMVKIGFELVDEKRSIVMGREEKDRTRTITIIPFEPTKVDLRLQIDGGNIRGSFRAADTMEWREAGACDLPAQGAPKLAIQCYQGPTDAEHWARIANLKVRGLDR